MRPEIATLLVVSHVVHYRSGGRLHAYGPYAREIDIWADLFRQVVIAAPCREMPPPGDAAPFSRPNVTIRPQPETGGPTIAAKAGQLLRLPALVTGLSRAMRHADAIHVRCPGNLGLLGAVLAPLFHKPVVAKYAGQWSAAPGECWTVRLQRAILRSRWWSGPVTVYGEWPGQPPHVTPFFTSMLDEAQVARARAAARRPRTAPITILFVGRLSRAKNVRTLLDALGRLRAEDVPFRAVIVGDGPERAALEAQASRLGLGARVAFAGGVGFATVLEHYERSDVLVLASDTEGWPKAITEAMAFGLICIGSTGGLVPWILSGGRGIVVPPRDAAALAEVIGRVARVPADYAVMRDRAAAWAQRYSLPGLRTALTDLLAAHWGARFHPARGLGRQGQAT